MWSMRARASRDRSPTPVPASIRMSSSTRSAVVRRPPPIPPLQPNTRIFIVCPELTDAAWLRPSVLWLLSRWRTDSRSIVTERYHAHCAPFHSFAAAKSGTRRGARTALGRPLGASRLVEELHLDPRDLD